MKVTVEELKVGDKFDLSCEVVDVDHEEPSIKIALKVDGELIDVALVSFDDDVVLDVERSVEIPSDWFYFRNVPVTETNRSILFSGWWHVGPHGDDYFCTTGDVMSADDVQKYVNLYDVSVRDA